VAELLGIGAAAMWYGPVNLWIGEPEQLVLRTGAWSLMSLAAVPEGLILGGFQAIGIKWWLPELSAARWIVATIAVGFIGWGIGTYIPMFLVDEAAFANGSDPGLVKTTMFAATFGIIVGAVFGLFQSWAFPSETKRRQYWIITNSIGWGIGLPLIYVAAQLASDQSTWIVRILLWAIGGVSAGFCVGVATGVGLYLITSGHAQTHGRVRSNKQSLI
jgi:hypothetical protein